MNTFLHPSVLQFIKTEQQKKSKKLIGFGCTRLPEVIPLLTPADCAINYEGLNTSRNDRFGRRSNVFCNCSRIE